MENELKSPKAGRVKEVVAVEGTAVENNAKLVVIE
jgi:biotin carboxyl carrier protein